MKNRRNGHAVLRKTYTLTRDSYDRIQAACNQERESTGVYVAPSKIINELIAKHLPETVEPPPGKARKVRTA